jgi:putative hemolysin
MKKKLLIVYFLVLTLVVAAAVFLFVFKGKVKVPEIPGVTVSVAAKNCTDKGGTVATKKRGDGKEYEICFFDDNRQCEALSLLNNECPFGGRKITGYITEAAQYCAILGGKYEITGNTDNVEDGNCSFFSGTVCNVWDLYNGKCEKGVVNPIIYTNDAYNFSLNLPRSWEGKYQVKEEAGENNMKYISFNYGEANLFKIEIAPFSYWDKEKSHEGEYIGRNNDSVFAFVYSKDPARSDKQWGEEYLTMVKRVDDIKATFKITKPYIFLEKTSEAGSNYVIEIMYPYVGAIENGQVNIEISNFVGAIVSAFKEEMGKADAWQGENTLKIYYDPFEINSDFVSIRFEVSEYNGGAHPFTVSHSFNYDFNNNKIIALSDLLSSNYLSSLSERSIQYLLKINKDSPFSDEASIREGASPKEENYSVFTFNKQTIVFYFNEDQVAPYVSGRQEVVFPLSSLKDILKSEAISGYDLKI